MSLLPKGHGRAVEYQYFFGPYHFPSYIGHGLIS